MHGVTSHELLDGRKLDSSHFEVFGYIAYICMPGMKDRPLSILSWEVHLCGYLVE